MTVPEQRAVDEAVAALAAGMCRTLAESLPGGWFRELDGATTTVTGLGAPPMNAVICARREGPPEAARALLDELAATGLPYCLETRDAAGEAVGRERGMTAAARVPFMLLDDPAALPAAAAGAEVRRLGPDELDLHLDLMTAAFGMPAELVAGFRGSDVMTRPGVRAYVATAGGEPVATSMAMTYGDHVGVFNVGTPEAYRGRGYGAAVTARAVLDGMAGGARAALLQSTDVGVAVYERLGFRTVETWTMWFPGEATAGT